MKGILRSKYFFLTLAVFLLVIPFIAAAQNVPSPIAGTTVVDIVFNAFSGFAGLFALLAMGFMIISGFKMVVAAGNEEALTTAKRGVTWSAAAMFIAIFTFAMISGVHNILGGSSVDHLANPNALISPTNDTTFDGVFRTVILRLLAFTGLTAVLAIVYGGIRLVTSHGNEEQVAAGKRIITWAVVGLVVIVLSYAIIAGINAAFS